MSERDEVEVSRDPLDLITDPDLLRIEAKRYRARIGEAVSEAQKRASRSESRLNKILATMAWIKEGFGERTWLRMSEAEVVFITDLKLELDGAIATIDELDNKINEHRAKCPLVNDPI